ncbi:hypothetical protein PC121_g5669 [Phytophthora cactorum]|nr:hypothetical protein PC121_g5669 [Phytophthora cactorum]
MAAVELRWWAASGISAMPTSKITRTYVAVASSLQLYADTLENRQLIFAQSFKTFHLDSSRQDNWVLYLDAYSPAAWSSSSPSSPPSSIPRFHWYGDALPEATHLDVAAEWAPWTTPTGKRVPAH